MSNTNPFEQQFDQPPQIDGLPNDENGLANENGRLPVDPQEQADEPMEDQAPGDSKDRRIVDLEESLDVLRGIVEEQNDFLTRLMSAPFIHGTVIHAGSEINPEVFGYGDKCLVIDETNRNAGKVGRIVKPSRRRRRGEAEVDEAPAENFAPVDENGAARSAEDQPQRADNDRIVENNNGKPVSEDGIVCLEFSNGLQRKFQIGVGENTSQIKLLGKNDGTNVTIAVSSEHYEVWNLLELDLKRGDKVKANLQTKQIVEKVDEVAFTGPTATVHNSPCDNTCEVLLGGEKVVVLQGPKVVDPDTEEERLPEEGDKVQLDRSMSIIVRHLPRDNENRHKLDAALNITFDDIAGVGLAKEAMREAIEYPVIHRDMYDFFNKKPPKGVLLYGPPGCGKTMLGKASTNLLARLHGKSAMDSGFIYVKGPELLDKWVGSTEQQIRELFLRGTKHYEKHNYPALLFIDEADAILPQRGTHRSSDVDKTIVPMFLSEMDGLNESHVIVVLATNRPDALDPAAVREGRCDKHIKVERPDQDSAVDYFLLHLRNIPLDGVAMDSKERTDALALSAATATAHLFSRNRSLYKLTDGTKNYKFCLGDAASGAMIKGVVDEATTIAMKRNIKRKEGTPLTGVTTKDFEHAVETLYRQHLDMNHNFDIEDFCDKHRLNAEKVRQSIEKCPG